MHLRHFLVNYLAEFKWVQVALSHYPSVVRRESITKQKETKNDIDHVQRDQCLIFEVSRVIGLSLRIPPRCFFLNVDQGRDEWYNQKYNCPDHNIDGHKANTRLYIITKAEFALIFSEFRLNLLLNLSTILIGRTHTDWNDCINLANNGLTSQQLRWLLLVAYLQHTRIIGIVGVYRGLHHVLIWVDLLKFWE